MEGKIVIMSVLLVSFLVVLGQIQVEAKTCCPSISARNIYNTCRFAIKLSKPICASNSGCRLLDTCPPDYTHDILENMLDVVNKYCKSGCVSSVCGAITNLQDSADTSVVVNGAVKKCSKACSDFCTNKGSVITTVVETTA